MFKVKIKVGLDIKKKEFQNLPLHYGYLYATHIEVPLPLSSPLVDVVPHIQTPKLLICHV